MHLAVAASHPIQYQAPLYRELARRLDLTVFFAHRALPADQAKAGFDVDFEWDSNVLDGFHHVFLPNRARRAGLDRFGGCDTPDIGARLAAAQCDALLVQGWHLKAYLQAVAAAKRLRLPVLARGDSHLLTPRPMLKQAAKAIAYPAFLRLFDAALYVGQRSRAYWTHYWYPKSRMFFSPHCVDTAWFAERATAAARAQMRARLGIAPDVKVLLFAGKLVPFKRPLDLIAATAALQQQMGNAAVLVAGSGALDHELRAAAQRQHVPLYQLGFRNQSEMPAAYAAADVLVLPSNGNETWGLVTNEALACGRPIVISDAVGAAPDLADDVVGHVFPVGDVAAMAQAIRAVFDAPPAPHLIAAKARAYSPAAAADGVEEALAATARR
jgi:glycosyltransferase involved in cell wall biosynthesis